MRSSPVCGPVQSRVQVFLYIPIHQFFTFPDMVEKGVPRPLLLDDPSGSVPEFFPRYCCIFILVLHFAVEGVYQLYITNKTECSSFKTVLHCYLSLSDESLFT